MESTIEFNTLMKQFYLFVRLMIKMTIIVMIIGGDFLKNYHQYASYLCRYC